MRVVGYVRPGSHTRLDCLQPLRVVCDEGCGHEEFWRCNCSAEVRCAPCAERKRRLLARIVDHGISNREGSGFVYFLTLTAPGEREHSRWIQGRVSGPRPSCDCHRHGKTLGEWNAQESTCWNRLRLALSRLSSGSLAYIGSVEVQGRGALHRHVVLWTESPLSPEEVQPLALAAGYGCVFDLQVITSAQKAAWYVSKYVTKSSGSRQDVPWVAEVLDAHTGEVRPMHTVPTFRTWSASQGWGYTMKGLREIARAQARARAMYLRELSHLLAAEGAPSEAAYAAAPEAPPPQ
jgi:hypothetical protein